MTSAHSRSPAQIEASRRNGALSRGPVSVAGKARAAMNAVRHGLTGAFAILPEEDPDAFAELHAQLVLRYAPEDPLAEFLVRRLAAAMWRLMRAERLEAEVLTTREHRRDAAFEDGYNPHSPLAWDAGRLNAVTRYESQHERTLLRCLHQLEQHQGGPAPAAGPDWPAEPFPGYHLWHPMALPNEPEPAAAAPDAAPGAAEPTAAAPAAEGPVAAVPTAGALRPRHPGLPPLAPDPVRLGAGGTGCYPGDEAGSDRGTSG